MRKQLLNLATGSILILTLSACGSKGPPPTSELALASSALESAELAGAREHAPIELRLAREKKAAADKAMAEEKFTKARFLTTEARVDAELARAAAEAKKLEQELNRAQNSTGPAFGKLKPASNSQ